MQICIRKQQLYFKSNKGDSMTETIDYKMICAQEETFRALMEAHNGTLKDIANIMRAGAGQSPLLDDIYVAMLDGTRDTYRRVMRSWFLANGANTAGAEGQNASDAGTTNNDGNVYDADYKVEDDENK